MLQDRETIILYTTAICNLNCTYCFIDKNPTLKKIDQWLDDSFLKTPEYYFDYAKKAVLQENLKEVQIWGGEPFLGMHRAYHTIDNFINYFPNLKDFMTSTNFVSHCFFEEFYGLLDIFRKHPNRKFIYSLQLSLDGIKEINDTNRGIGVTDQFIINFERFIKELQDLLPENLTLRMHLKPTIDTVSLRKLQTKENVYNQFKFFESFNETFLKYNKRNNLFFSLPVPNTACPSPHTQEDGILFANYCKITRELERENEKNNIFKFYKNITSYNPRREIRYNKPLLSKECQGHCGNGKRAIGLLPNNMVSCCHNGFVDLLSEYKKNVLNKSEHMDTVTIEKSLFKNERNKLIFPYDSKEFEMYQKQLEVFYQNDTAKISNCASLIKLLADYGQIDKKYSNKIEAIYGAYFIFNVTSYCVRDNLGVTGSIYMYPIGLIKLLLNGAREYIEKVEV